MPKTKNQNLAELKEKLSNKQYNVCILGNTEPPFLNKYWNHHEEGEYVCAVCGQKLFSSKTKFDSGSGWPSFWDKADKDAVEFKEDLNYNMQRTEVVCKKCKAHLGHIFNDGPKEHTGKRYCINSAALNFKK